jgi:hypothetical protein
LSPTRARATRRQGWRAYALLHRGQVREAAGEHEKREATAGKLACSSLLCTAGWRCGARLEEDASLSA